MVLLISTDGFSITTREYNSVEDAYKVMSKEFHSYYDNLDETSEKEMSGMNNTDAIVYNDGEGVYVWEIYER